ncbi:MAG: hypothetical protein PUE32_10030 [Clostridia bacterium]|nr:hypothetical protein [Clostridia bacterium]
MYNKKTLAVIGMTALMLVTMAGCGSKNNSAAEVNTTTATTAAAVKVENETKKSVTEATTEAVTEAQTEAQAASEEATEVVKEAPAEAPAEVNEQAAIVNEAPGQTNGEAEIANEGSAVLNPVPIQEPVVETPTSAEPEIVTLITPNVEGIDMTIENGIITYTNPRTGCTVSYDATKTYSEGMIRSTQRSFDNLLRDNLGEPDMVLDATGDKLPIIQ